MTADLDDQVSDAELVAGFQRDPEAFHAVFDRYRRDIFRYVAGRLDRQAADDVTAETFLTAFRARGTFDPGRGELRPWLFGIATNMVARHRRKEARHYRNLARGERASPVDSHENHVVAAVEAQRVQPQLAKAPVRPVHVHLVNLEGPTGEPLPWMTGEAGDACELPKPVLSGSYDLVFSNSVIEHVGGHYRREQFPESVHRLAERHWVQAPYRYFPLEPH